MLNEFSREELLLGKEALERLNASKVAVFGIGGVGSFAAEGLARSGIGHMTLIDDDRICLTNINRQIHAVRKTVGKFKAEVMRDRLLEINPSIGVEAVKIFYTPETAGEIFDGGNRFDYIIDAVDTVTAKLDIIVRAKELGIPVISCMGAGNKLDPTKFEVADIYETAVCPLAKVMRHELRRRGIDSLKVVYSREKPIVPAETAENSCKYHCVCPPDTKRKCTQRRQVPGSISFVPSVAGLIIAGEVVKDLAAGTR